MIERTENDAYEFAAQEDRSAKRSRISIPATLRASGGKSIQTAVCDLSLSGFNATAITPIAPKTCAWLTLPGFEPMTAKVVWWENGHVGCAFDTLLSTTTLDTLMDRWQIRGNSSSGA